MTLALRWRRSSVSFGTISCTSPTTPRSLNSKIGAFGSLLIATITFELCMPTLCWTAPEMPSATYSFGETVLPVWPIWAAYGYQPASTTARVAPTAPPSARASSSASVKFSGRAEAACRRRRSRRRPRSTGRSAPRARWSTTFAPLRVLLELDRDVARPAARRRRPRRRRTSRRGRAPSRGSDVQPTSTSTESCSAGRLPTSSPSLQHDVDEIPVEAGVEPRREPGRDVRGEHRVREQHGVVAAVARPPSRARRRAAAAAAARARRPRRRTPSSRRSCRPRRASAFTPPPTSTAADLAAERAPALASTPSEPFCSSSP